MFIEGRERHLTEKISQALHVQERRDGRAEKKVVDGVVDGDPERDQPGADRRPVDERFGLRLPPRAAEE